MADTGPSEGFLSRIFSSFGKKKQTDIELPAESGEGKRREKELGIQRKKKKKSILQEFSSKYNPFQRISDAMTPKDKDEE